MNFMQKFKIFLEEEDTAEEDYLRSQLYHTFEFLKGMLKNKDEDNAVCLMLWKNGECKIGISQGDIGELDQQFTCNNADELEDYLMENFYDEDY